MKQRAFSMPEIGLIAITRGLLGIGAGLLLADRLEDDSRKWVGRALLFVGVVSTFPLLANVFRKKAVGKQFASVQRRIKAAI